MARRTGITDQVVILDSGASQIEGQLGWIEAASHEIEQNVSTERGIGVAKPQYQSDGLAEFNHGLTIRPVNFRVFKLLGTDTTGTKDISLDDTLPEFTVQHKIVDASNDQYVELKNAKFGSFTLDIPGPDEDLEVDFDGLGRPEASDNIVNQGSLSPNVPSSGALQGKDLIVKVGGTSIGSVESGTISLDRNLRGDSGIADVTNRRLPEALLEGNYNFLIESLVIKLDDDKAWEEVLGNTGSQFALAESRSTVTVTIEDKDDSNNKFDLTGVLWSNISFEMNADDEVRTVEISGPALDMTNISYGS